MAKPHPSLLRLIPLLVAFLGALSLSLFKEMVKRKLPAPRLVHTSARTHWEAFRSVPVSTESLLVASTEDGIVAVDKHTSQVAWIVPANGTISPPLLLDNQLYVATSTAVLAMTTNGTIVWEAAMSIQGDRLSVVHHAPSDVLVASSSTGYVLFLDKSSGRTAAKPMTLPCAGTVLHKTASVVASLASWMVPEATKSQLDETEDFQFSFDFQAPPSCLSGPPTVVGNTVFFPGVAADELDKQSDNSTSVCAIYSLDILSPEEGETLHKLGANGVHYFRGDPLASLSPNRRDGGVLVLENEGVVQSFDKEFSKSFKFSVSGDVVGKMTTIQYKHVSHGELIYATTDHVSKVALPKAGAKVDHDGLVQDVEQVWQVNVSSLFDGTNGYTPTILSAPVLCSSHNWVVVQVGIVKRFGGRFREHKIPKVDILVDSAIVVLQEENGQVLQLFSGTEEYVADPVCGDDGTIVVLNHPVRRSIGAALWGNHTRPLQTGATGYRLN